MSDVFAPNSNIDFRKNMHFVDMSGKEASLQWFNTLPSLCFWHNQEKVVCNYGTLESARSIIFFRDTDMGKREKYYLSVSKQATPQIIVYQNSVLGYYDSWKESQVISLTVQSTEEIQLTKEWMRQDKYFFTDNRPRPPTYHDLAIPHRNQAGKDATVFLHRYLHIKGQFIHNDISELLEHNFDDLILEKQYNVRGLSFFVLNKKSNSVEVVIKMHTNLLTYNLICTAKGNRLELMQGQIDLEDYEPDSDDVYRDSATPFH